MDVRKAALYGSGVPIKWHMPAAGEVLPLLKGRMYSMQPPAETFLDWQNIGSLWFLPGLFFARLLFTGLLKLTAKVPGFGRGAVIVLVACAGVFIGQFFYLPFSLDVVMVACLFMYIGYLAKGIDLSKVRFYVTVICLAVWFAAIHYHGINMAERLYPYFPLCIIGAAAGSFVIAKCSMWLEKLALCKSMLGFLGRESLLLLCMHRLETSLIDWYAVAWQLTEVHPYIRTAIISGGRILFAVAGLVIFRCACELISRVRRRLVPVG